MAAALLPGALAAAELYRWVDAQGRPHVADKPPPNPPANMTVEPMPDPDANTLPGVDPQERLRLQQERQRAVVPAPPANAATGANADCASRWAAYRESQACFESYRTADSGLKPQAFQACGPEVLDPSPQCGPPR